MSEPNGPEATLETDAASGEGSDRRAMLAAALDALPEGSDEGAAPAEAAAPDAAAADAAPGGPARDEKGRFTAKEGGEGGEPPQAAAPAATPPQAAETPPAAPDVAAPASWRREMHEAFSKADPALREYIVQREEEIRRGVEPLIPKARFADEFDKVIANYQGNLQAAGNLHPLAAVHQLMQADHILRNAQPETKRAYARQLLQEYGVDLSQEDWSAPTGAPDPRLSQLQNELQSLRTTVQSFQQQQTDSQNQALLSDIEAFKADKPHFEAIRPAMAQLLQSGKATDLQDAYDQAMKPWASVLADADAARQAAAEAERRKAADQAAKQAKAAAVSPRSSTPSRAPPAKAPDRRAMLAEQLDGLDERV
jgi:hypothetical protein